MARTTSLVRHQLPFYPHTCTGTQYRYTSQLDLGWSTDFGTYAGSDDYQATRWVVNYLRGKLLGANATSFGKEWIEQELVPGIVDPSRQEYNDLLANAYNSGLTYHQTGGVDLGTATDIYGEQSPLFSLTFVQEASMESRESPLVITLCSLTHPTRTPPEPCWPSANTSQSSSSNALPEEPLSTMSSFSWPLSQHPHLLLVQRKPYPPLAPSLWLSAQLPSSCLYSSSSFNHRYYYNKCTITSRFILDAVHRYRMDEYG